MTLSKQLGFGFFCVLFLVFAGTLYTNVNNTRYFIEQQLSSHAQDTATSLGLSITPYVGNTEDLPIIETMTNAIFDRGYYLSIELQDLNGNALVTRINPEELESVPAWFSNVFSIKAPAASSEITDGWNRYGNLVVVTHPGFAYSQLWNNAVSGFWVALAVFLLALVFVWVLVKRVISEPINTVIEHTEAITQKQFAPIQHIPKTRELKSIVLAINVMSEKLQSMFKHLGEQSEKYRLFAYSDQLTQVGNRRAFELAVERTLRNEVDHPNGHLLIVRASSLAAVHKEQGGELGDTYLRSVCTIANAVAAKHLPDYALYRIAGADFAIWVEYSNEAQIKLLVKELSEAYKRQEKTEHKNGMAHIGVAEFSVGSSAVDILEKADSALAVANTNEQKWAFASSLSVSHSNETWRNKIQHILSEGTADFASQDIVNKNNELAYSEWFARLPSEKNSASAPMAQLIPASIRLDYAQSIDKLIVKNLLEHLVDAEHDVGLNVSRMSLFDAEFMQWFTTQLHNAGSLSTKLVLEIPERALIHDTNTLLKHVETLKSLGVKIAIEHFGAQLAGITHIRKLQPHFIKLDGRFTRNIHTELDNQLFLQSLISIAKGFNIQVIAEMVETESEMTWLLEAGVDLVQGYYIAPPKSVVKP